LSACLRRKKLRGLKAPRASGGKKSHPESQDCSKNGALQSVLKGEMRGILNGPDKPLAEDTRFKKRYKKGESRRQGGGPRNPVHSQSEPVKGCPAQPVGSYIMQDRAAFKTVSQGDYPCPYAALLRAC